MEFKDATAMSQAIREKRISSRELVEDAIQTIEKLNPLYNAVVSKQYETVLRQQHYKEDSISQWFGSHPQLILLKKFVFL